MDLEEEKLATEEQLIDAYTKLYNSEERAAIEVQQILH